LIIDLLDEGYNILEYIITVHSIIIPHNIQGIPVGYPINTTYNEHVGPSASEETVTDQTPFEEETGEVERSE